MNMLLKLGAAACLFAAAMQAQHLTVLSATHILDTTGALGNGTLCFIPSASPYTPSGVSPQSGNTCYTVTAGMISGASLYDAAYITPQGFSYTYQFTQTSGSVVVLTISGIQITGTLFNLDTYAVPSAVRASGNGSPNVNCQAGARFVQLDASTSLNTWTCVALNGITKWYLDPTQVSGNPAGTGLASPGTDNVLLAYSHDLLTRPATFADILPIIGGTPGSTTFINGLGQWATPSGAGNVSTSSNLVNGNVPKATGITTLADGGQAYPGSAFVGRTDTQALTHKDLTDASNVFPTLNQNTTGRAGTASNLATAPTNCTANGALIGISANGNPTACQQLGCPNIENYGGFNNGSTPNDSALAALVAANISDQQCVYFPEGHFKFSNAAAWTAPTTTASIVFKGDGSGVTQLIFPTAKDGIDLNLISTANAFHVSGLTLRTQGVGTSVGINVNNTGTAMSEGVVNSISDVAFQGDDCQACTDYWSTNIRLHNALNVAVYNNHVVGAPASGLGTGVAIDATGTPVSVVFNINGNEFDYVANGVTIGDNVQGVNIGQNNFTGVVNGVFVGTGIVYGHDDQLIIGPGNQFNGSVAGISINSPFRHTQIFSNYFVVSGAVNGIFLDNYAMTSIANNHLINVGSFGGQGIYLNTYANDDVKIIGNDTQFFANGVNLQPASQHVTAFMNKGVGNTVDVLNLGTGNASSVTCSAGTPSSSFQVVDGVIVHC